jgi:hypothetical protein
MKEWQAGCVEIKGLEYDRVVFYGECFPAVSRIKLSLPREREQT